MASGFIEEEIQVVENPQRSPDQPIYGGSIGLESDGNRKGVVYSIRCKHCNGEYIGQTGRMFKERMKEHEKQYSKSAVAKHFKEKHPSVNLAEPEVDHAVANILKKVEDEAKRLAEEKRLIAERNPDINRRK